MIRRRGRHLRRRSPFKRIVVLSLATLGLVSVVAVSRGMQERHRVGVTLLVGGVPRAVQVAPPGTVREALEAGNVVPRSGRLLSVVTQKVLDPARTPYQLLVDGLPATESSPLVAGSTISVVEPPDEVEAVVDGSDLLPPPPMPVVISGLWHPGHPGRSINRKGVLSGEVVAQLEVQAPVPPAPVKENLVALTFDDGPWSSTGEVLRILREKKVKATFCVVTNQLKGDGLEMVKGALGEGHRLCNHTTDHDQKLPSRSQKVVDEKVRGANEKLVEKTGVKPAYYRPPGGKMSSAIEATVKDEGQQVLLWTVDTKDFQKLAPAVIVATVMGNVKPGGVVLLHDGGGDRSATLAALPTLIDQLRAAGYELVLPDDVAPVPAGPEAPSTLPA